MAAIITRIQEHLHRVKGELEKVKNELENKTAIVAGIERNLLIVVSNSASAAQMRRGYGDTLNLRESLQQHLDQIGQFKVRIKELEVEIADYEAQKREYQQKHG